MLVIYTPLPPFAVILPIDIALYIISFDITAPDSSFSSTSSTYNHASTPPLILTQLEVIRDFSFPHLTLPLIVTEPPTFPVTDIPTPTPSYPSIEPTEIEPTEFFVSIAPVITLLSLLNTILPSIFPCETIILPERVSVNLIFPVVRPNSTAVISFYSSSSVCGGYIYTTLIAVSSEVILLTDIPLYD